MAELSVFIPDTVNAARWENVGNGRCLFLQYIKKPKFFQKRSVKKHLERAKGTYAVQSEFAEKLSLPLLSGRGDLLTLALCHRLVPQVAEERGLVLSVGEEVNEAAILEIARRVRELEIISEADMTALCDKIEEETGLCVPMHRVFHPTEKIIMRLPGGMAAGKDAIDLSSSRKACLFSPPAALRPICQIVGSDGDTLEALLRFFGFSYGDANIFLSKITKLCRK